MKPIIATPMTNKPSLYLIPGFLCNETVWEQQISALNEHAQISVPDFRNMKSFEEIAHSILATAPEKFSVVGHSMGGRIVFELLHLAEHRIEKCAVLSTAVHPLRENEKADRQALINLAKNQGMNAFTKHWTGMITNSLEGEKSKMISAVQKMAETFTFQELKCQIETLLSRNDQSKYLSYIKQKVLLVCGENDHWSSVAQHEEMARQLNQVTMIIVKNAGHMVTLEQPEKMSDILVNWFCNRITSNK